MKRLTPSPKEKRRFFWRSWTTVFLNILPDQLANFRMNTHLALFAALTKHLDITLVNVPNAQTCHFSQPQARISHEREDGVISKALAGTHITHIEHLL